MSNWPRGSTGACLVRGSVPVLAGNALALVSTILWSSAFPTTEFLLRSWDPLVLAMVRLAGAAAFILLLASLAGQGRELARAPLGRVFVPRRLRRGRVRPAGGHRVRPGPTP